MEPILIETQKCRVLAVKVPDDAKTFQTDWKYLIVDFWTPTRSMIAIPEGSWQILGLSHELKELDMEQLVEHHQLEHGKLYYNYDGDNYLTSVDKSYASLLKAHRIWHENPYGKDEPELMPVCCGFWTPSSFNESIPECCGQPIPSEESIYMYDEWQEAQARCGPYLILIDQTK